MGNNPRTSIEVEECTLPTEMVRLSDFPNERSAEVSYHMSLLIEAGLVKGQMSQEIFSSSSGAIGFSNKGLTWEGHELLDSIRNDTVWAKTKKAFKEKGVSMTFELVKTVAMVQDP